MCFFSSPKPPSSQRATKKLCVLCHIGREMVFLHIQKQLSSEKYLLESSESVAHEYLCVSIS